MQTRQYDAKVSEEDCGEPFDPPRRHMIGIRRPALINLPSKFEQPSPAPSATMGYSYWQSRINTPTYTHIYILMSHNKNTVQKIRHNHKWSLNNNNKLTTIISENTFTIISKTIDNTLNQYQLTNQKRKLVTRQQTASPSLQLPHPISGINQRQSLDREPCMQQ